MKLRHYLAVLALLAMLLLVSCITQGNRDVPLLTSSAKIDLQRYMGAWHVIANVPYFAENGKVATRDVYTLNAEGEVETTYVYRKAFGEPEKTAGSLGIVQPNTDNRYWVIRIFWLFRADYLILETAPDYSWALIGQPSRKLGWVFSRDAAMDDKTYSGLLEKFRGYGYEPDRFKRVPQFAEQVGKPGFQ